MEGYELGDPYWIPSPESPFAEEAGKDPGRLRIGFTAATPNMTPIEPVVEEAMKDAARLLEELGHEVVEFDPGWVDPELSDSFIKIVQINPVYYGATDPELLDPVNAALLEAARGLNSVDYVQAKMKLEAMTRRLAESWQTLDVLLTPTLAMAPVPVGWAFEEEDPWMQLIKAGMFIPFTPPANISGLPAVSVPLFWSDEGMPIGVQMIGRPADEATLIRVSAQLEEARPWATRHPPLS
jgi:amidase